MGLWDAVGSIGIPETSLSSLGLTWVRDNWNAAFHGHHNTSLSLFEGRPHIWDSEFWLQYSCFHPDKEEAWGGLCEKSISGPFA